MPAQVYNWTCSICSFVWVIQSTGIDTSLTRKEAETLIGNPECVNPTYGLMSIQCLVDAFASLGVATQNAYCTFQQAYSICRYSTGVINLIGMYHFMAIRGVRGANLWVANSALGYRGVYEELSESAYNDLGPTQLLWIPPQ